MLAVLLNNQLNRCIKGPRLYTTTVKLTSDKGAAKLYAHYVSSVPIKLPIVKRNNMPDVMVVLVLFLQVETAMDSLTDVLSVAFLRELIDWAEVDPLLMRLSDVKQVQTEGIQ